MAADDARPTPMLTPHGGPAMADWSLDQVVRHLNHGSLGAVPLIAQRAQAGLRQIMDENPCSSVDVRSREEDPRRGRRARPRRGARTDVEGEWRHSDLEVCFRGNPGRR